MGAIRATDGLIEVSDDGGTTYLVVASLQDWTIDRSNNNVDTTVLGAQRFQSSLTTFLNWSISCNGFYDPDDRDAAKGQGIISAAATSGDYIDIRLTPSAPTGVPETTGDEYVIGQVSVSSVNESGAYDGAIQVSYTFEGNGAYTSGTFPVV
jgi:predicted secreted protein